MNRTPCLIQIALAFAVLLSSSITSAADSRRLTFPWEQRSAACHEPAPPPTVDCGPHSWPDENNSGYYIASLLTTERFALLEEALESITKSTEKYATGRPVAIAVVSAFNYAFPSRDLKGNEGEIIARWKTEVPDSRFAPLAEAHLLRQRGWSVRGTGYMKTVSQESWSLFHKRMREALAVLDKVPARDRDAIWYYIYMDTSLDADSPPRAPQEVMEEAVKRWPDFYPFYGRIAQRLVPKWGGSWRELDAFINKWSDRLYETEGKSMYARLYMAVRSEGTISEMRLDWPRMKEGLIDLAVKYPAALHRNLFASYACAARDREAYAKAMTMLPKADIKPQDWLTGHSPEACFRWATTDV